MKRIITLFFILAVIPGFSQELLSTKLFYQTTTPHATYERYEYYLGGQKLLEEQLLLVYDQSGDLLKSSSTLGTVKKELLPTQSAYRLA